MYFANSVYQELYNTTLKLITTHNYGGYTSWLVGDLQAGGSTRLVDPSVDWSHSQIKIVTNMAKDMPSQNFLIDI